jgi:hypothetical protein
MEIVFPEKQKGNKEKGKRSFYRQKDFRRITYHEHCFFLMYLSVFFCFALYVCFLRIWCCFG